MRDCSMTNSGSWSKQARVLCELLDEAREEFDDAVRACDSKREQRSFDKMLEVAKMLDQIVRCDDEQIDDLLM